MVHLLPSNLFENSNGISLLRIMKNGKVGIGTSTPTTMLDINGNIRIRNSNTSSLLRLNSLGSTWNADWQIFTGSINGGVKRSDLTFWTNNKPCMVIQNGGNVGIGTSTPQANLDVSRNVIISDTQIGKFGAPGSTAGTGYVSFGEGFVGWDYKNGGLGINAHGAGGPYGGIFVKRVDNGHSNVGVGTTNPGSRLDVTTEYNTHVMLGNGLPMDGENAIRIYYSSSGNYGMIDSLTQNVAQRNLVINPNGGFVGIGTTNPQRTLDVNGTTRTAVLQITGGSDLSENFDINTTTMLLDEATEIQAQPGMVVSIDAEHPGELVSNCNNMLYMLLTQIY